MAEERNEFLKNEHSTVLSTVQKQHQNEVEELNQQHFNSIQDLKLELQRKQESHLSEIKCLSSTSGEQLKVFLFVFQCKIDFKRLKKT